jgi:glycosyltransferase involved in cell wall biosynthesis
MKVTAIIPVLNEEATLQAVLRAVLREPVQEVIVVDNGSTDNSAEIARRLGARVIDEPRPGYGWACQAGFLASAEADVLVYLDGDGADNTQHLSALLTPIQEGRADLVLGSRTRGETEAGALLPHARFGNWLASQLMRRLYDLRVSDLGPFRAIRREVLEALAMREMTFGWPTEMMVKAARQGYRVVEIPVGYRRRAGGQSKISGTARGTILAAYYILWTTVKYAF